MLSNWTDSHVLYKYNLHNYKYLFLDFFLKLGTNKKVLKSAKHIKWISKEIDMKKKSHENSV